MTEPGQGPGVPRWLRAWLWAVALLVPARERATWREEWLGEFAGRWDGPGGGMGTREALRRAAGALPDAADLRRRRTVGEMGTGGWRNEMRFALRGLARRPGLTAVSLGTLAAAVGVGTTLFAVAEAVLLRPLPFHEPDRLVRLWGLRDGERALGGTISYPNARDVGDGTSALAGVALFDEWRPSLAREGSGRPEVVAGGTVSASFFRVLGVEAALGRIFRHDEEGEGREPVVVLGHDLWSRTFGADSAVVGRPITADGTPYTVVGVLPPDFETPGLEGGHFDAPEIWRTVARPSPFRSGRSWSAVARLADGVDLAAARAEVAAVFDALTEAYPDENAGRGMTLVPLRDQIVGDAAGALRVLLGAVGLVLLVACANVAGLLLVRAAERRDELALRAALGASRGRLAGVAVLEGLVLAVGGTVLGVVLAGAALPGVRRWVAGVLPRSAGVSLDAGVLAFAAGAALLTGLACGGVAAWAALRTGARGAARPGVARGGSGPRATRARRTLVVAEVAVAVVLLVGGAVLLRSLGARYAVELGVERRGALAVELHSAAFTGLSPEEAGGRYDALLERLRALPGVRAAGAINIPPLSRGRSCDGVLPEGEVARPGEGRCAEVRVVVPGALEALGVPILRGRALDGRDAPEAPGAMVVSRSMAEAFWPGEEPLGRRATIHGVLYEVVGVAGDVRHFGPDGDPWPQAYLPAAQEPWGGFYYSFTLVLAADRDPLALVPGVRRALDEVDPAIAVTEVRTLDGMLDALLARPRFHAAVLSGFAALATFLAVVGLGGLLAYSVRQRTREIGIRVALGAEPAGVAAMVAREGGALVLLGCAAGLAVALAGADVLGSMVAGVGVRDPWSLAATVGLVAGLGLAASWAPARRAAGIDPVRALGGE